VFVAHRQAEIVRRLAAEGADVGFTYHTGKDEAEQVAGQVRGFGRRVLTVRADLAEATAPAAVVAAVAGEFGRLDILVNNAGITHWGSVAQTSAEDFDRLVAVDARAPFLMMQAAANRLADGGRVVNISSGVTSTALAGIALYSGAKAFLEQVTKIAAIEFAARRITVNAVGPGSKVSGPFRHMTAQQKTEVSSAFGLGRIGEPADTAAVVASWPPRTPGSSQGRSSTTRAASAGPSGWIASNCLKFGTRWTGRTGRAGETGRSTDGTRPDRRDEAGPAGRGRTGGTRPDRRDEAGPAGRE
jgi:3-oxoacyl-[acyl-carrier protein] reductase